MFRHHLPQEARDPAPIPELSHATYDRALYLYMAALATLLGEEVTDPRDALAVTLEHEERYWWKQILDLTQQRETRSDLKDSIPRVMAAVTLYGGLEQPTDEIEGLLHSILGRRLEAQQVRTLRRLLCRLYGPRSTTSLVRLDPLQPDLLGEQLVYKVLSQDPGLLSTLADLADSAQASRLITILARIAKSPEVGRKAKAAEWIDSVLEGRLEKLGQAAFEAAVQQGDPIGMILAARVEKEPSQEVAEALLRRCDEGPYQRSLPLRELALAANKVVLEARRKGAASNEDQDLPTTASLLNNLGSRQSALGDRDGAM
ncbi:MAG: hypothetical protein KDD47_24975, partial [Acidobacteria bacterium]|nr:hypothetical protein [Acidobacteriota bacterium]